MFRILTVPVAVLALASCGDPLKDVQRIGDVDVDAQSRTAAALPTQEEIDREGFLGTAATRSRDAASSLPSAPSAAGTDDSTRGFFGLRRAGRNGAAGGPDTADVPFGTILPFGEIARVCGARGKPLGRKTDQTAARGLVLHDSVPGSTVARTFYVTGFDDKCPRQFTAANALFGAPSLYEQLRFSGAGAHLPYADTDAEYDKVKSRVCGAGKAKPCGSKVTRLDRNTVFVSAYERYDNNARWKEFLLHDGQVLAAALKSLN